MKEEVEVKEEEMAKFGRIMTFEECGETAPIIAPGSARHSGP